MAEEKEIKKKEIKKKENPFPMIEIFKIDSVNGQNNLILCMNDTKTIIRDTSLFNIYDIIKERYLADFMKFMCSENKKICEMYKIDKDNLTDIALMKQCAVENQKPFFGSFKNYALTTKKNVYGYLFLPINKRIVKINKERYFNINNPKLEFNDLTPIEERKFPHLELLMKNILQEGYEHFLNFLAWKLQKPTELIPNHWVIQDRGGTGKTEILGEFILERLFNIAIIGQDDLNSQFNAFMSYSTIVICEEIEGYENEKKIKMLTGSKFITINEKNRPTFKIRNFNNFIIFSNSFKALKISNDDRRFNVVGGGKRLIPTSDGNWEKTLFKSKEENKKFFKEFHEQLDEELRNLYQYLIGKKVERIEVQQNISTKAKSELIEINNTSEIEFLREMLEIGIEGIAKEYWNRPYIDFLEKAIVSMPSGKHKGAWVRSKEFYQLYKFYSRDSELKTISKNNFFRRIKETQYYDKIFSDSNFISFDNQKFQALKIKSIKFETDEEKKFAEAGKQPTTLN